MQKLYKLTIPLPDHIEELVMQFRREIAQRYRSVAALKPMGHMSLQESFVYDDRMLADMQNKLAEVFDHTAPFRVELENFGAFPSHTIFVAIRNFFPFMQLRDRLYRHLGRDNAMPAIVSSGAITPHITVAYRDLAPEAFELAWSDFCQREFNEHFTATAAHLMEHRGKWRTLRVFPFQNLPFSATQPLTRHRFCA